MEKYNHLMLIWTNGLMKKSINVYNEKGKVKTVNIRGASTGEIEFMSVVNEFGAQGWEMVGFYTEHGWAATPPFHIRAFLKKKILE